MSLVPTSRFLQLGETIQVLLLPIRGLTQRLEQLKEERGWGICSRLYALALGLQLGASFASDASSSQQLAN